MVPNKLVRDWKRADSNLEPQPVVSIAGTPKTAIHHVKKAFVTISAEMSVMGTASGQRESLAFRFWSNQTDMYVMETSVWVGEGSNWSFVIVPGNHGALAFPAGPTPLANIFSGRWAKHNEP